MLIEGRYFNEADASASAPVAIVNETLARRVAPGGRVIRSHIHAQNAWREIVGVIEDVKQFNLTAQAIGETFLPAAQQPVNFMTVIARTSGSPSNLVRAVTVAIQSIDNAQSVPQAQPMTVTLSATLAQRRFPTLLLGLFGALALVLSTVGIYGVASYHAAGRTQEIGVRMALGATPRSVIWLVLGQGIRLGVLGFGIGLGTAFAATRLLSSMLYRVGATDPLTFASVGGLLLVVTSLACWIPARRAVTVDPIMALHCE